MQNKLRNWNLKKEKATMKKNKGIAILLFAILLQMCSSGMELLTLGVGVIGLLVAIIDDNKKEQLIPIYQRSVIV